MEAALSEAYTLTSADPAELAAFTALQTEFRSLALVFTGVTPAARLRDTPDACLRLIRLIYELRAASLRASIKRARR